MTVLLTVCRIFAQEAGFIPYKLNKKWIVLDTACHVISKEKYDTICLMYGGLARVEQKSKWGYINKKGETIIPLSYDEISGFDDAGYARVRNKKKWGFVNRKSELIIPLIYDTIELFNPYDNYAKGRLADSVFFVDRKGNRNPLIYHGAVCGTGEVGGIYFEAQVIKGKNGWGLLNNPFDGTKEQYKHPDTLVPCIYKKIIATMESSFAILINNKYSLYNTAEKKMLVTNCDTIFFHGRYNTPYWAVFIKNSLKGCATPNGKNIVEANYKSLKIISTDYIYVTDAKNKSYYINSAGKKFIPSHARTPNKSDTTFKYEVSFIIGQRDGYIISNKKIGIADTNLAFVKGQFTEPDKDSIPFANVVFINEDNGTKQRIATNFGGRYKIFLKSGKYTVQFVYVGRPTINLPHLLLEEGQRQEINVCLGENGITHTVLVKSKSPLTEKELQEKANKLKKEWIKKQKKELAEKMKKEKGKILIDNSSPPIRMRYSR